MLLVLVYGSNLFNRTDFRNCPVPRALFLGSLR